MYRVPMKMNAKKLPPSNTLTAFAPASVLFLEDPQRHQRRLHPGLDDQEGGEQDADTASSYTVLAVPHPACGAVEIA